jgi:hypothetical protein
MERETGFEPATLSLGIKTPTREGTVKTASLKGKTRELESLKMAV